jgi:Fic family protein
MTETNGWGDDVNAYVRRPGGPPSSPPRVGTAPKAPARSTAGAEAFAATGVRWDASKIELERIERTSTPRARFRFEKSLADLVWNAAALEGNTFTLPEVRTLLDGVTVGGRRIEEEKQVLALVDGYSRLDDLVGAGRFALTKAASDDLHGRVATHEAIESGAFRGEGTTGGGGNVRLASGGIVAGVPQEDLQARFVTTVDFLETLDDPRERALAYFAAAMRAQFYFDGNKRTARLMMSGILMADGYEVVNIPFARQFEFNKALDELFTDDDATALMSFIADCALG